MQHSFSKKSSINPKDVLSMTQFSQRHSLNTFRHLEHRHLFYDTYNRAALLATRLTKHGNSIRQPTGKIEVVTKGNTIILLMKAARLTVRWPWIWAPLFTVRSFNSNLFKIVVCSQPRRLFAGQSSSRSSAGSR